MGIKRDRRDIIRMNESKHGPNGITCGNEKRVGRLEGHREAPSRVPGNDRPLPGALSELSVASGEGGLWQSDGRSGRKERHSLPPGRWGVGSRRPCTGSARVSGEWRDE